MAGLKICTRWRAISARRRRRISSSLLPENIGPTTTSIQPILPLTMSTVAPLRPVIGFQYSVFGKEVRSLTLLSDIGRKFTLTNLTRQRLGCDTSLNYRMAQTQRPRQLERPPAG